MAQLVVCSRVDHRSERACIIGPALFMGSEKLRVMGDTASAVLALLFSSTARHKGSGTYLLELSVLVFM